MLVSDCEDYTSTFGNVSQIYCIGWNSGVVLR